MDCYTQERPSQWICLLEPAALWTLFDFFLAFFPKETDAIQIAETPSFSTKFCSVPFPKDPCKEYLPTFPLECGWSLSVWPAGCWYFASQFHRSCRCPLSSGMGGGYWARPSPEIARAAREQLLNALEAWRTSTTCLQALRDPRPGHS